MAKYVQGGDKLKRFLRNARQAGAKPQPSVEIGFVAEEAGRAIANEFGIAERGIPERPFFRHAIREAKPKLAREAVRLMAARGHKGVYQLTEADSLALGAILADEVRTAIAQWTDPPNRPWKGKSDPLVFSGAMAKAVIVRTAE